MKWTAGSILLLGFPGGSVVKNLPANSGDPGDTSSILRSEDPLEKKMATHSNILPGESHEQRSLEGYSPWGPIELDVTE